MNKPTFTSKLLADKFREDSREAISALAKRLYAKHHDGHIPWEGDIDPDADVEFHQDLNPPVSFLASVDHFGSVVWEEDFIVNSARKPRNLQFLGGIADGLLFG